MYSARAFTAAASKVFTPIPRSEVLIVFLIPKLISCEMNAVSKSSKKFKNECVLCEVQSVKSPSENKIQIAVRFRFWSGFKLILI